MARFWFSHNNDKNNNNNITNTSTTTGPSNNTGNHHASAITPSVNTGTAPRIRLKKPASPRVRSRSRDYISTTNHNNGINYTNNNNNNNLAQDESTTSTANTPIPSDILVYNYYVIDNNTNNTINPAYYDPTTTTTSPYGTNSCTRRTSTLYVPPSSSSRSSFHNRNANNTNTNCNGTNSLQTANEEHATTSQPISGQQHQPVPTSSRILEESNSYHHHHHVPSTSTIATASTSSVAGQGRTTNSSLCGPSTTVAAAATTAPASTATAPTTTTNAPKCSSSSSPTPSGPRRRRINSRDIPRTYSGMYGIDGDLLPFECHRQWVRSATPYYSSRRGSHAGSIQISWLGTYLTFVILVQIVSLLTVTEPAVQSWTLTNFVHLAVTIVYIHWLKGSLYDQQGEMNAMTAWEQLEAAVLEDDAIVIVPTGTSGMAASAGGIAGVGPTATTGAGSIARRTTTTTSVAVVRRILLLVPTVLTYLACHFADYQAEYCIINGIFWSIAMLPKVPFMNGVRIFGINRTVGIDDDDDDDINGIDNQDKDDHKDFNEDENLVNDFACGSTINKNMKMVEKMILMNVHNN